MSADCSFCKIVDRSIPAPLVHSDEHCVAFRDIHPQAPSHLLVIPRQHLRDLPALSADRAGPGAPAFDLAGHLLTVASQVAQAEGLHAGGFRIVINTGGDGGQTVFHLHLHILGGRALGWPPG